MCCLTYAFIISSPTRHWKRQYNKVETQHVALPPLFFWRFPGHKRMEGGGGAPPIHLPGSALFYPIFFELARVQCFLFIGYTIAPLLFFPREWFWERPAYHHLWGSTCPPWLDASHVMGFLGYHQIYPAWCMISPFPSVTLGMLSQVLEAAVPSCPVNYGSLSSPLYQRAAASVEITQRCGSKPRGYGREGIYLVPAQLPKQGQNLSWIPSLVNPLSRSYSESTVFLRSQSQSHIT